MPLILGTNSIKDTGYNVDNSLRFNSGSSDTLSRTFGTSTSQKIFTWSLWYKKTKNATNMYIFENTGNTSLQGSFVIGNNDKIVVYDQTNGSLVETTAVYRDPSAWYHIVMRLDTTQSTASDRVRIYINNVQQSLGGTQPSQNTDYPVLSCSGSEGSIGKYHNNSAFLDGYLCEVVFCDGQSLAPTSFGEFDEDSGIWKPIDVSGLTFGNNGFYLDFENSGSLGADVSGNGNNFTVNNLTSVDQSTDTCTNNFATLNPLDGHIAHVVFSEGNLKSYFGSTNSKKSFVRSSIGVASGKWYFEVKNVVNTNGQSVGITDNASPSDTHELGYNPFEVAYINTGEKVSNSSVTSYANTYTTNDIIGVALDLDNNALYFSKNGTFQNSGDPTSGASKTGAISITAPSSTNTGFYFFCVSDMSGAQTSTWSANFGSPPFSISSGNSDGNGYGNFEYAVPSGYYSLNSKNLAEYG